MKPKPNITFIIISILIVAAGAYWYFFANKDSDVPLTPVAQSSGSQARFQSLLSELMGVTFDTRVFSDARFMALVDLTTPITPETPGRIDPFAPLGTGALATSTASRSSTTTTSPPATPRP